MGFMDDLRDNVITAANAVSQKTNEFVDYSKLKFTASGLSNEIKRKYQALGEEIYTSSKIGADDTTAVELLIQEIDDLKAELQATNELITAARKKVTCPVCKAEVDKESAFCNKCGARIVDEAKTDEKVNFVEEDEFVVDDPFKEVVVKSDSDEDAGIPDVEVETTAKTETTAE